MTEHAYTETLLGMCRMSVLHMYVSGVNSDLIRGTMRLAFTLSRYNTDNDKIDLYYFVV